MLQACSAVQAAPPDETNPAVDAGTGQPGRDGLADPGRAKIHHPAQPASHLAPPRRQRWTLTGQVAGCYDQSAATGAATIRSLRGKTCGPVCSQSTMGAAPLEGLPDLQS